MELCDVDRVARAAKARVYLQEKAMHGGLHIEFTVTLRDTVAGVFHCEELDILRSHFRDGHCLGDLLHWLKSFTTARAVIFFLVREYNRNF